MKDEVWIAQDEIIEPITKLNQRETLFKDEE